MGKKKTSKKTTPLMRQYFKLKAKYPDAILLYRVGDFYETFGDDAKKAADILGIVLTSRNNGGSDIALAGFPHHSLDLYLPKLVKAGLRVALCEQLEKPSKAKKVVKRGVTEIVTPGLAMNDQLLDHKSNNFLAAIHFANPSQIGLALLDLSTGEFLVNEGSRAQIDKLIQSFHPSEIIYAKGKQEQIDIMIGQDFHTYGMEDWIFTWDFGRETLLNHFDTNNLKGFGIEEYQAAQVAAGAALRYLNTTENNNANHINKISRIQDEDYVWLDKFTIRNLELLKSPHPTGITLTDILDKTVSPMGARQLKKWIVLPLTSIHQIEKRHEIVAYYVEQDEAKEELSQTLSQVGDLERLISKVPMAKINPRELDQLKKTLDLIPGLKKLLENANLQALHHFIDGLNDCPSARRAIEDGLDSEPPTQFGKEKVIADGHHPELDEYRDIIENSKERLVEIQTREADATGINNLKIGFNNVFGYYLEVTNKYKDKGLVPESWVRKQTLTNSERYITEELKELEDKILSAEEKSLELEQQLFDELVEEIEEFIQPIQYNAQLLGELDCLLSFAKVSRFNNYVRPEINDSSTIDIRSGRHPVIEQNMPLGEEYIPNDTYLDNDDQQIMMITGPNMSGKSAILRQTALICLMAQIGCFVPADKANLGYVDKIFTRVGASDNISSGESTFMVEMNETSSIMNNVSNRSLILLDEIGRGTSTYDGISIAWAIAEYLHNSIDGAPKTLFATHYHELNQLADKYERIKNFNVSTQQTGEQIIFLRKLKEGGSAHSFGIHVAKMAGMPDEIIRRSRNILSRLESKSINQRSDSPSKELNDIPKEEPMQLSIFDTTDPQLKKIREMLSQIEVSTMTPIDCMLKLKEFTDMLEEEELKKG